MCWGKPQMWNRIMVRILQVVLPMPVLQMSKTLEVHK
jgi:hypothetical protein